MCRKNLAFCLALACAMMFLVPVKAQTKDTVRVMFYNLLNFPTGGGGVANRQDTLAKIVQHVQPDLVMVCELVNSPGAPDLLLNSSFNTGGITYFQRAPFVPNTSTTDNLQQLIFYNADKLVLDNTSQLATDLRDINKYILHYKDPNLLLTSDTTFLDVYVTHLKASSGATNETRRNQEITVLRNHLNTQPTMRNAVFGADINMYTSSEAGYQTITTTGSYPMQDPIARPGNWNNNGAFADIHTQSTRINQLGGDGAGGGLDDRFDQILASGNVMSGANRVRYIPGTYHAVGQDGNHFNLNVTDPPANSAVPQTIASALFYMSDHLPVVMDLEFTLPSLVPVVISSFEALGLERSILLQGKLEQVEEARFIQVERAAPGQDFYWIADLNLQSEGLFSLQDKPSAGLWRYRLKMQDWNGNISYSSEVTAALQAGYEWQVVQGNQSISVYLAGNSAFKGKLELMDMTGRIIATQSWDRAEGHEAHTFDMSNFSKGMAMLKLTNLESGWEDAKLLLWAD